MRFLFELAVFGVIASISFTVVFGIVWAMGYPFGLDGGRAALLAGVFLFFWLPAFGNVHIAVSGSDGESRRDRICAAVRACGMLVSSAVFIGLLVAPGLFLDWAVPLLIGGSVLWLGSCFFE